MFTGSRVALPSFRLKTQDKRRAKVDSFQNERFKNERNKVDYIISQLKGLTLYQAMSKLNEETRHLNIADVVTLLAILKVAFDDPNATPTASGELHNLKQVKNDFWQFQDKFTRLIGNHKFNEVAKRDPLEQAMSDELKETMIQNSSHNTNYAEFVRNLQKLDNNIQPHREDKAGKRLAYWMSPNPNNIVPSSTNWYGSPET